jgi:hypothetical protein
MSYEEILGWFDYFKKRPIGWREDNRTSMLLLASGAKIKADEVFPSLAALRANNKESDLAVSLRKSAFFSKIVGAVGGDKIDIIDK